MSTETFVIVGGGLAAARAIEAIREAGHRGRLVLVGEDPNLPYDRPPLSKAVLTGTAPPDSAYLHPSDWYADRQVELRLGVAATRLDPEGHTLSLADGTELGWDRLLLATGSSVRRLDVPGAELNNVLYLRDMAQSATLRSQLEAGGQVIIVGAGWIGLEVAAAARGYGCQVTVVEPQPCPLYGVLGATVGGYFADLHTSHGVTFRFGEGVERLLGGPDVTGLITTTGTELMADTVVVGVGITPNTALAEGAGLDVDNGILCDQTLRTSSPDVFAAGDVANWFNPTLAQHVRVEHWANAQGGGYAAGRSMTGEDVSFADLPFFFSDQYDIGLEYTGYVPRDTAIDVVLRGNPQDATFMAFWMSRGKVLAGMHVNDWGTADDMRALVRSRKVVDPRRLADPTQPLIDPE